MVGFCSEKGISCAFANSIGQCKVSACQYPTAARAYTPQVTDGIVRCPNGHILGVFKGSGILEIRHKGRTVTVSGISNVTIRCEQCGDEIAVLTPGGCVLSMGNSREHEFANKQSGGLP